VSDLSIDVNWYWNVCELNFNDDSNVLAIALLCHRRVELLRSVTVHGEPAADVVYVTASKLLLNSWPSRVKLWIANYTCVRTSLCLMFCSIYLGRRSSHISASGRVFLCVIYGNFCHLLISKCSFARCHGRGIAVYWLLLNRMSSEFTQVHVCGMCEHNRWQYLAKLNSAPHFYRATPGLGRRNSVRPSISLSVHPSIHLSRACFVTNPKNLPAIFVYHMKGQSF